MGDDVKPVYNAAGTHVFVKFTESGVQWECPVAHLQNALAVGYELTEPRDASLDGLYDPEVLAAKVAAKSPAKKAAPKNSGD